MLLFLYGFISLQHCSGGSSLNHQVEVLGSEEEEEDSNEMNPAACSFSSKNWCSISTISTADPIKGYPFGSILSVSDGPVDKSSGTPYAYITRLDLCGKDLLTDDRASLAVSEAQSDYCKTVDLDPEDPRCARVLLSGTVEELKNGTSEAEFAKEALFSRHPVMKTWPQKNHNWIFVKMNIKNIYVFDYFGGVRNVAVEDYYNAEL
ncbi:protein CREG1-like isoform X3 [Portunus trituberculatus]|uniref:protein CREG1-like isoform X3 n=1 Tax=Portunus trituberculatus TaxID=210409 RepID=UPI001E1CB93E|nr:protein CREG1-like isoform X3 [Portunus trituberculatus]